MTIEQLLYYWIAFFCIILCRYFLISGAAYWYFYVGKHRTSPSHRSLRSKPVRWTLMRKDMELSVGASILFALCAATITIASNCGSTLLYLSVDRYGWGYLIFSYVISLLIQDTYFYFIHRAFHHPKLFKWTHLGHHRSGDPTPWTAFAFDPLEVMMQALFLIAIVYIIPLHYSVIIALLITMTVWSVWNHLGFELFSSQFPHHWLSRWFIGPTHHAIHHRKHHLHYGLYFTFWDRLISTHDPLYDDDFVGVLTIKQ